MTRSIPADSMALVVSSGVLATEFADEVVILSLRDGIYYGLQDVGARIWQLLQRPTSLPAIRDALVREYEVEPTRCERDLSTLLTELVARGLVEIRAQA